MAIAAQIPNLKTHLTSACQILTDSHGTEFQEYAKRWSDINRQIPAAIVLPTTEGDIQKTVSSVGPSANPLLIYSAGPMGFSQVDPLCDPKRGPQ